MTKQNIIILVILTYYLTNFIPCLSDDGSHQIEASHSNSIPSFDDSIYYKINWPGKQVEQQEDNAKFVVQDDDSIWITTANNERYHCVLPKQSSQDLLEDGKGKIGSELSPYQLLKPLFIKELCSYRLEQYWTYEICHGKFIRQFHEESGVKKVQSGHTQEFLLGKYDISQLQASEKAYEDKLNQLKKDGQNHLPTITVDDMQLPYIEIVMTGGTMCDLSNTQRITRVFYVCNQDAKHELYSIKETSTCEYEAIILSPVLCLHPDYKVTLAPENDINCYSIGKSPAKPKGLRRIENESKKEKLELMKRQKEEKKNSGFPNGIFEGKAIIIGASEFGKELRINIISEEDFEKAKSESLSNANVDSKIDPNILRNFLSGDHCLHGGTGWWRYEYCYGHKVEQYHEEKGSKTTVITLGKWDKEKHINWLEENPTRKPKPDKTPRQISHFYSNGDLCDVTGRPRQVEVKLKCRNSEGNPDSVSLYLLEPKTCEYILGIESPIICHLLGTIDENGLLHHPDDMQPKLIQPEVVP